MRIIVKIAKTQSSKADAVGTWILKWNLFTPMELLTVNLSWSPLLNAVLKKIKSASFCDVFLTT